MRSHTILVCSLHPVGSPLAAPPIAALCRNANKLPAATDLILACHHVAILPATRPVAEKRMAPRMAANWAGKGKGDYADANGDELLGICADHIFQCEEEFAGVGGKFGN